MVDDEKKVDLKNLFYGLQKEMLSSFNTNRDNIGHYPTQGEVNEDNWINWMKKYLPKRYTIDRAMVIDSEGRLSQQQDLVIYDRQYTPFVFNRGNCLYIPAESVYAVFEIKPTLNKKYIDYAREKIESVRKLKRTSTSIEHAGGKFSAKEPHQIIGGILTYEVEWESKLGECFKANIFNESNDLNKIDIGISLEEGSFIVNYNTEEISISSKEESLITFFIRLIARLKKCGTVPAIDIEAYAQDLDSI